MFSELSTKCRTLNNVVECIKSQEELSFDILGISLVSCFVVSYTVPDLV